MGARDLTIAIGMNYLGPGERLFKYPKCERTSDLPPSDWNYRVAVGLSDTSGTNVLISRDDMRAPNVGLAVGWKLDDD